MDSVVVSIGGSFLVGPNGVDLNLTREIAAVLKRVAGENRRVFAVVGGGAVARTYIEAARQLGQDESSLDDLGIDITRINARILIAALGKDAYPRPPQSFDEALLASRSFPLVIMGGTHAGHTTDAVTTMMAEKAKAQRIIIATNVDGVYDSDPKQNPQAKRLTELSSEQLVDITIRGRVQAGSPGVVDPMAAKIIARSGIETAVVKGTDLKSLEAALLGRRDFNGSLVKGAK